MAYACCVHCVHNMNYCRYGRAVGEREARETVGLHKKPAVCNLFIMKSRLEVVSVWRASKASDVLSLSAVFLSPSHAVPISPSLLCSSPQVCLTWRVVELVVFLQLCGVHRIPVPPPLKPTLKKLKSGAWRQNSTQYALPMWNWISLQELKTLSTPVLPELILRLS